MGKIEYYVAYGSDSDDLSEAVNRMINDGWRPQGGVAMNVYMHTSTRSPSRVSEYAQAMVREVAT